MKKKAYIQPHTEMIHEILSDDLLSTSTFKVEVMLDEESNEIPEARYTYTTWDDDEDEEL